MRDFLFRGKQIDNDEWVFGSFCMDALELTGSVEPGVMDGFIRVFDPTTMKMVMHEVYRETVGQYTGMVDKNRRKIFEHDIVKEPDTMHEGEKQIFGKIMRVEMKSGCWFATDGECCAFLGNVCKYWEVIGNIHDNPELLRENV